MKNKTKKIYKYIAVVLFILSIVFICNVLYIKSTIFNINTELLKQRMSIIIDEANNLTNLQDKNSVKIDNTSLSVFEINYIKTFCAKYSIFRFNDGAFVSICTDNGEFICNKNYFDSTNFKNKTLKQIRKTESGYIKCKFSNTANSSSNLLYFQYYKPWKCYFFIGNPEDANSSNQQSIFLILLLLVFATMFTIIVVIIIKSANFNNKQTEYIRNSLINLQNGIILSQDELNDKYCDEETKIILDELYNNYKKKTEFVVSLSNGTLENISLSYKKTDELGLNLAVLHQNLIKSKEELIKKNIEEEKRNWTTRGIADFSDILRKNHENIQEFCYDVIRFVVKYLKINQGGIFINNDTNKNDVFLELQACIAYDRRKYLEKRIEIGEGLVGSSYLEKQTYYLTKIPENYTTITSGLGEATAKALLIVPLKYEENVYGVIELASLKYFEQHTIQFVEKIAESIALSIANVKNKEITKFLLEQSELQREDLRNKEEEMLQNMEELSATQEEISKKSNEMESTIAAIDETIGAIEFKPDETIIKINDLLVEKLKIKKDDIIRHRYSEYFRFYEVESNVPEFWNDLLEGRTVKRETKYAFPNSNILWFQETYNPIHDKDGKLMKILAGFIDISELKKAKSEMENTFKAIDATLAEIELGLDGKIIFVNEFMLNLIKQNKQSLIGKFHIDVLAKDTEEDKSYEGLWESIKNGQVVYSKRKYKFSDEKIFWFAETYCPLRDLNNQIYSIFIGLQDITEFMETQNKKVELSKKLHAHLSLEENTVPVVEFNKNGTILKINNKFLSILGYTENNNEIKELQTILLNKEYFETTEFYKEIHELKLGKSTETKLNFVNNKGETIILNLISQAILSETGNIQSIISFIK